MFPFPQNCLAELLASGRGQTVVNKPRTRTYIDTRVPILVVITQLRNNAKFRRDGKLEMAGNPENQPPGMSLPLAHLSGDTVLSYWE